MDIEELQQELDNLKESTKKDVESLKLQISNLENQSTKLDRYLDTSSKDIITEVVKERFIDIFWDSLFYYQTWFESPDGFTIVNSATIAGGGCAVTSPGTGVASSSISVTNSSFAGGFSFSKDSRMRSTATFTRTTNQDIRIGIGDVTGNDAYGFRLSGSTLQGFAQTAPGTRTTFDLLTITANTEYDLSAIFSPKQKIDFWVDSKPRGTITTNLPTTTATKLWEIQATESSAETKQIFIGSFEYIQKT